MNKLSFPRPRADATEAEEGQGLVEYGMVLMLIALVVIVILSLLGPQVGSMFSAVKSGLT